MIIENGTISLKQKTAGGINPETGLPNKNASVSWSEPIPCQYIANKYNNLAKVSGEHVRVAEYQILIEAQDEPITSEQLILKDGAGNTVKEASIIWLEPLDAVCETRIWI